MPVFVSNERAEANSYFNNFTKTIELLPTLSSFGQFFSAADC